MTVGDQTGQATAFLMEEFPAKALWPARNSHAPRARPNRQSLRAWFPHRFDTCSNSTGLAFELGIEAKV